MAEPPHTSEYSRSSVHPALMTVAFLEGFIVLAVELISAKMIAPFYGVSLIVWATVIGITLASLTTGYFIGGFLSKLDGSKAILFRILLFSALMMALMPLIAQSILYYFDRFGLSNGILLSAFILISPSLILLGATSPILIQLVTKNVDRSGKAAGNIYAISTAGGILSTFLFGFFIIPEWGLRIPVLVLAFLLFAASQLLLYQKKQILFSGIILSLTILISFMIIRPNDPVLKYGLKLFGKDFSDRNNFHLLLNSEGLLGQLKVLDHFEEDDSVTIHRQLLINGIPQTYVLIDSGMTSYWQYVHTIATLSTLIIDKSEALLFGFGGGSLALELIEQGFKVDAVEIDNRMWEITEQYFELDKENTTMIIDDARHYLKTTNKKYDIIIFDLASAEVQPSYVFTLESFLEMSDLLDENGMIIINEFILNSISSR
ncbi:MAG: fused MFS/spermidine synthase, partial [Bacteroidetes bacterium]|nr:fused MFS/spermidine synthase [Bacteroidota bacterium]